MQHRAKIFSKMLDRTNSPKYFCNPFFDICPVRLAVRTPDFHSGNRGSIPLRDAFSKSAKRLHESEAFFVWYKTRSPDRVITLSGLLVLYQTKKASLSWSLFADFEKASRRGIEPLLPEWKSGVLTARRTGHMSKNGLQKYFGEFVLSSILENIFARCCIIGHSGVFFSRFSRPCVSFSRIAVPIG